MSVRRTSFPLCLIGLMITANAAPAHEAVSNPSELKLPMSVEEVARKRRAVREEVMLPSLSGIRGIAYRVVGFKDYLPLEKVMSGKLAALTITKIPLMKADGPYKDCDAVVQITFSKLASHTIAELKVTQFASLVRDPKITVKAVTYSNKVFSAGHNPEEAVAQLCDEFVIDFLKANQKGFNPTKNSAQPAGKKKKV